MERQRFSRGAKRDRRFFENLHLCDPAISDLSTSTYHHPASSIRFSFRDSAITTRSNNGLQFLLSVSFQSSNGNYVEINLKLNILLWF